MEVRNGPAAMLSLDPNPELADVQSQPVSKGRRGAILVLKTGQFPSIRLERF